LEYSATGIGFSRQITEKFIINPKFNVISHHEAANAVLSMTTNALFFRLNKQIFSIKIIHYFSD